MRLPRQLIVPLAACLLSAACNSSSTSPNTGLAHLRVVNAATSGGSVTVFIDGGQVGTSIAPATSSAALPVLTGTRTVELRTTGGFGLTRSIVFTDNADVVAVGIDSAGGVAPEVLSDTNAIVPAGASKLRVAHMAQNAGPIDIWRTQPDWSTPIRVEFPFPYRAISPYLQSTPGDWRILVSDTVPVATPNAPMPDTLADSGPITVTDGTSATVIVVDKPGGGVTFVVVRP